MRVAYLMQMRACFGLQLTFAEFSNEVAPLLLPTLYCMMLEYMIGRNLQHTFSKEAFISTAEVADSAPHLLLRRAAEKETTQT